MGKNSLHQRPSAKSIWTLTSLEAYRYIHIPIQKSFKSKMFWILCEFTLTTHKKGKSICGAGDLYSLPQWFRGKQKLDHLQILFMIWSNGWYEDIWNSSFGRLMDLLVDWSMIFCSKSLLTGFPFSFRVASLHYSYPFIIKCTQVCPVSDRFSCCECGFFVKKDLESSIVSLYCR